MKEPFNSLAEWKTTGCAFPARFSKATVLLAQQLPDALWMTGERKLWRTNTIKLLGNIIGRLMGVLWLLELRGDNESHHSLLGWKKRSLSCGDAEWACVCTYMCLFCYICSPVRLNELTAVCFSSAERISANSSGANSSLMLMAVARPLIFL